MIEIEKGIPCVLYSKKTKYPFKELEVGDSFFLSGKTQTQMSQLCSYHSAKMNKKFSCSNVDGGVRIWRTK